MTDKCYSELQAFKTLEDRYQYLKLSGSVGVETFGFDRYLNQRFYMSHEWRSVRNEVIVRDLGCELGVSGFEIHKGLYVHHMNPMVADDIIRGDETILDPEFLITCTHQTHNAIHYGDKTLLTQQVIVRKPGDTKLW